MWKMRRSVFPRRPATTRQQLQRQPAAASGAATPGSWGPLPFARWGLWGPPLCELMAPTLFREYLFPVAVGTRVSLGCQPGSSESASPLFHLIGPWVASRNSTIQIVPVPKIRDHSSFWHLDGVAIVKLAQRKKLLQVPEEEEP